MTETSPGSCLCGQSRFEYSGNAKFAIRCFCRDCQHASGGGHMPQMAISKSDLNYSGPVKTYEKISDAGNTLHFYFCEECGSPLFKTTSKMPDLIFVNPGNLKNSPTADFSNLAFRESRAEWDALESD